MASSQSTSFTEMKKESIIDGRLFVQSVVMEMIQTENDDVAAMEHVVSRIQQSGLFNLERQHSDLYDGSLVEEFYQEASVCFHSFKKGGDVAEISSSIRGVEIRINRHLLEDLFSLPSSGLKMDELESFRMEDLLSSFWCVFIGDIADKKSGQGNFIGGSKYTSFNKDVIPADRPSVFKLPHSANLRDVTDKPKAVSSKKRKKHSLSDKKSHPAVPVQKKKKLRKSYKSEPTEVTATPVEAQLEENAEVAQPTAINLQGATSAEEVVTAIFVDPEPMAAMADDQLLANVEGTGESTTFPESIVTAPVRVSTLVQDPSPHREPSPVQDPSPLRAPTPIRIPSLEQASIPIIDPKPIEIPILVRIPSPTQLINDTLLSVQIEQAFESFVQWKSYSVAVYDLLYPFEDCEEDEKFILEITDTRI
ncbi:hypothetical protein OROMI_015099 [Orobanche minor]